MFSRISILVVTPAAGDFEKLKADLEGSGIQPRSASDLLEALLAHAAGEAFAVVCDAEDLDWKQVLDVFGHSVPVIFITRFANERLWQEMLAAGAFDVLDKSYRRFQLQWAVLNALGDKYLLCATA